MDSFAQTLPNVADVDAPALESRLCDVAVGGRVKVIAIRCARVTRRRLMELGLLPGTSIEVVRVAPLGDPIELRLRNYSLCLRRSEATNIDVE